MAEPPRKKTKISYDQTWKEDYARDFKGIIKEHIFTHLEQIKQEKPSSQIVMNIILPPETPGGVTVTRDILQLGEDGSIKQVSQPATNLTLNQVYPLKELEAAGVIKLDSPHPAKAAPTPVAPPSISTLATQGLAAPQMINLPSSALMGKDAALTTQLPAATTTTGGESSLVENMAAALQPSSQNPIAAAAATASVGTFIKEEDGENDVSEIIENTDGTFSVAFKGPNNEMQHIQIIRPEGIKGEMMLELTNVHNRRRSVKGLNTKTNNQCDICGKVLSSSTNLLRHKMYHSSERPFVCQTCGKGFKDVSNLKKHTMIHNRIFPCHLCKKSFLRKSLLVMHLKRHQARTVFVKCGNGAKEVTLRTYVDDDGTRVEEMSMVALSGQTFEYKKRIAKGEPSDVKPTIANGEDGEEDSSNVDAALEGLSAAEGVEAKNNEDSLLDETLDQKEAQLRTPVSGDVADDLPDLNVPEPPKDFIKMYQCGHCGKRTVQRGNMMRHLIHHLSDKPFACDECSKQFVDKGELVKHKKTHSKPYRCNQCNGAFAHNVQLMKHQESECMGRTEDLKYTVLEDGQLYRCDICQIEMKRLGNMIKHVGTHSGGRRKLASKKRMPMTVVSRYSFSEEEKTYKCGFCQGVFKQKANLLNHMAVHTDQWGFECPDCSRYFPSKTALDQHSSVHLKPFKCDRCPAVFSRKLFLKSHMQRHKEKERGEETDDYGVLEDQSHYYCKHCDKRLSRKYRMMNHIRSHLDNRPYECAECNKCFSSQYMLSSHRKMHTKQFTCDSCGEAFTRQIFLQIHRKKHHEMKQDESHGDASLFSDVKDKAFQQDAMDSPDGKSFMCYICGSTFSRLVIKLNHEKKCKEEKKILVRMANGNGFQCKICRRISTLKHNLMVHIRKSHSDLVRFDPSGHIQVRSKKGNLVSRADENDSPPKKRFKLNKTLKGECDLSDDEIEALAAAVQEEGGEESDTDERYTRTPGGYACATCRTKFVDRIALFSHLEMHSGAGDKGKESQTVDTATQEEKSNEDEVGEENSVPRDEAAVTSPKAEKDLKTPAKSQSKPAKLPSTTKAKGRSKKLSTPALSTPKSSAKVDTGSSPVIPTSSARSSNRPPRTQKIPSRFLE